MVDSISNSYKAILNVGSCLGCGICINHCPNGAIPQDLIGLYSHLLQIDETKCVGCGICVSICPQNSIKIVKIKQ